MTLEQTIVISREELSKIVEKFLKEAGHDARYISYNISKDDFNLKEIEIVLSSKDIKI